MDLNANPNTRWSAVFVDELVRCGLRAVCIAPGSRSTPLTLAFAGNPTVTIYRHLDERSAGFFALGLAKASGQPVALVCTSGTAAANFHPAVIEAYYSFAPLLVLTADRPPELRQSGANQTIDQIKMYGDHVRWSVEMPVPQDDAPEIVLRHVRTLAARAFAMANGLSRGPVHLNFPFRKPLEPPASGNGRGPLATSTATLPYTQFGRGQLRPAPDQVATVARLLEGARRGVIVCGPECPGGEFPAAVASLAQRAGLPILADALAGVRHGRHVNELVLGGYNLWLPALAAQLPAPDFVLRFGAVPTSAALTAWLSEGDRGQAAPIVHVREDGEWADDQHRTGLYVQANAALFCAALEDELIEREHPVEDWARSLVEVDTQAWAGLAASLTAEPLFDGGAIASALAALPDTAVVFAGNSMPVRYIDGFDRPSARPLTFFGNRGASGIDGNVSTALGLAAATGRPVVAFLGDITFYHDMNGLLAARQCGLRDVTFVVTNNDGGGIFHRLPVAHHEPPFRELFLTPHGLRFDHAAAMYGLDYVPVTTTAELQAALATSWMGQVPRLIEILTESSADYTHHRAVMAAVAGVL